MSTVGPTRSLAPLAPIAAGVRAQLDAHVLSESLDSAGLLDPDLATALDSIELSGRQLALGGVVMAKDRLLGGLMDQLA